MPPSAKDLKAALKPAEVIFGFTLHNIPTINLRLQYARDRANIFENDLSEKIHAWRFARTAGPVTVTYPDPDVYFTTLLRTTIVGIECTLQHSVIEELLFANRLTKPLYETIRRPGKLSRSMADAYYNKIPELLSANAPLQTHDKELWVMVSQFYKEIRNPISHGYQIGSVKAESLRLAFQMFDHIYGWIDSWSDPHRTQKILASTKLRPLE